MEEEKFCIEVRIVSGKCNFETIESLVNAIEELGYNSEFIPDGKIFFTGNGL